MTIIPSSDGGGAGVENSRVVAMQTSYRVQLQDEGLSILCLNFQHVVGHRTDTFQTGCRSYLTIGIVSSTSNRLAASREV